MSTTIAISGKGGTGKTTLTAMIIRSLIGRSTGAVLAVDADPNACLGMTLGVQSTGTVADLRDDALEQKSVPGKGPSRLETFEYGMEHLITEAKGFDLLAMGRPEGPKCYCAVNHVLRKFLDQMSSNYGFVVVDNEAGMEHLSRRTTNNIDLLIIAAEATAVGKVTAKRIIELTQKLPISVKEIGLIWNRTSEAIELDGLHILGCVPQDQAILEASIDGKSIFDISEDSPAYAAISDIMQKSLKL